MNISLPCPLFKIWLDQRKPHEIALTFQDGILAGIKCHSLHDKRKNRYDQSNIYISSVLSLAELLSPKV